MPLNLSVEGGKRELREKSLAIGRRITANTESLYFLHDLDLLRATLRSIALFGFCNPLIDVYEKEENLILIYITFKREFHEYCIKNFSSA